MVYLLIAFIAIVFFVLPGTIQVLDGYFGNKKKKKKEPKPEPYYFEWSTHIVTRELFDYVACGVTADFREYMYRNGIARLVNENGVLPAVLDNPVRMKMDINNLSIQEAKLIIQYYDMEKQNETLPPLS